ncbi:flagellar protein FlaG [Metapseudomonas lalkuanensis]|uniref:Flagellar protein FlaG n=1 Tax=Metapseudomonas lalkuanensis TaxID=2604832 RepID=A0A5J6QI73_9GAMM|nr:flagellar protein FlaG [Pseudomonas lalkuanensis]QEY62073.1 flagellar protein FlaG [Pseudomonas lalkuanensis]UCO99856.1 flagellar protein FlaG [Pseudomonas lalkuanensis]
MDIGIINLTGKGVNATPAGNAQVRGPAEKESPEKVSEQARQKSEAQEREPVEAAASSIQEFVQSIRRNLNFDVDDSSGRVVVQVTDTESGEVIRQIPSEDALKLAESLSEMRSLLFKAEA